MGLKDALLADYDHEMGTTRRLLERVPDDRLSWKPHERSMSLGGLATHLSHLPHWGGTILNDASFDLASGPPRVADQASRADILAVFDETSRTTRGWLAAVSDGELQALWTLKRGTQQIFTLPRAAAFRSFVLHHVIHHRGQLSVYLRLNNVAVPAMYGPSADEG